MNSATHRRLIQAAVAIFFAALPACSSTSDASTPSTDGGVVLGQIGDPCPNGNTDCAEGLNCAGEDPGGQCEKPCAPSMDSDCGDTSKYVCNFEGHCYVRCTQTSDCKRASEGYVCRGDEPARPPIMFCDVP